MSQSFSSSLGASVISGKKRINKSLRGKRGKLSTNSSRYAKLVNEYK
jgi:hypothetical protein